MLKVQDAGQSELEEFLKILKIYDLIAPTKTYNEEQSLIAVERRRNYTNLGIFITQLSPMG